MIEIDESTAGREVQLALAGELRISLKENPTTGFKWVVEGLAQPVCDLVDDQFESATTTARGSGGVHHWRLVAKQKGEGKITLNYQRPWETKDPLRTFSVSVRVT